MLAIISPGLIERKLKASLLEESGGMKKKSRYSIQLAIPGLSIFTLTQAMGSSEEKKGYTKTVCRKLFFL